MVTPRPIGSTFATWLRSSPEVQQVRDLPHRLSLVSDPNGSWDDFIRLWPNRDLPFFVAHALPEGHGVRVDSFTTAHHFAAMFGIVTDRVVDGQCDDRDVLAVRRRLLEGWLENLAIGLGDAAQARAIVGAALRAWKQGIDRERRVLGAPHDWDSYAIAVVLRLRWISTTAAAMLRAGREDDAAAALETSYDQFLLALQILDDCADADEDLRCRGHAFGLDGMRDPTALCGLLLASAARAARAGGLTQLAAWMTEFGRLLLLSTMRSR